MSCKLLVTTIWASALVASTNVFAQGQQTRALTYFFQKGARIIHVSVFDSPFDTSGSVTSEDPTRKEHAPDRYHTERQFSVSRAEFSKMWSTIMARNAQKFALAKNDERWFDYVHNYAFSTAEAPLAVQKHYADRAVAAFAALGQLLSGSTRNYVVPKDKAPAAIATLATELGGYAKNVLEPRKVTGAEIVEYGILKKLKSERFLALEGTVRQKVGTQFVQSTSAIEASVGKTFGIGVKFLGEPDGAIIPCHFRCIHPKLTDAASGRTNNVDEWEGTCFIGQVRYTSYTFDYQWELVSGKWTIQVVYGGKVVAEKAFDVRAP